MRPTRSWLFTPATRPERFAKADDVGADVLIIDLEDAVAPADKARARETALDHLCRPSGRAARALRINALDTPYGVADLHRLLETKAAPDFLVLPKTESAAHLAILDRLLSRAELDAKLIGLIESARGVEAVDQIAQVTPRLHGLMLGAADMAADLGAEAAWEPLLTVRARLVQACALGAVDAIDSPLFDIGDVQDLSEETRRAMAAGFVAKAAIHPAQIGPINEAFTPSDEAIAGARKILAENEKGVGVVDGQMIDEAVARKARRLLAAAGH